MSGLVSFLTSKVFFKNLVIISLSLLLVVAFSSILLSIYTAHGEKMPMPDLRGMTMDQVKDATSKYDFELKVVDSVFMPDHKKGAVIDHSPKPGFNIKKSRVVFITLNSVNPEMVAMPELVNTSLRQAKTVMESCGLQLGRLKYRPDFAENYVLEQLFKGRRVNVGTKLPKGSKIDLVLGLGNGEGKKTTVPNLVGLNYKDALSSITSSMLNVGAKIFSNDIKTFSDTVDAVVWKQDPPYSNEQTFMLGSLVDIWLKKSTDSTSKSETELIDFEDE